MPRELCEVDPDLDSDRNPDYNQDVDDGPFEFEDFAAMGINPMKPTAARPGTEDKVLMREEIRLLKDQNRHERQVLRSLGG